jgi:hypothetical protein
MHDKPEADGDSTGSWRARTGTHHELDTRKLRELDGVPAAEEMSTEAVPGTDPYNRTLSAQPRRRSLDDMRKLSETIKKSRTHRQQ